MVRFSISKCLSQKRTEGNTPEKAKGTSQKNGKSPKTVLFRGFLAFPGRFELPTFRLGGGRSILLSYGNKYEIDLSKPRLEKRTSTA